VSQPEGADPTDFQAQLDVLADHLRRADQAIRALLGRVAELEAQAAEMRRPRVEAALAERDRPPLEVVPEPAPIVAYEPPRGQRVKRRYIDTRDLTGRLVRRVPA
jgi:hypothetical protein